MKYSDWKEYLLKQVEDGCIYLWGGQGESLDKLTDTYIKKKETSVTNANRVIKLRDARKNKYPNLKAYDCSGLGVAELLRRGEIKSDISSSGIYGKCLKIDKKDLKKGDFVFRHSTAQGIYHIGYVIEKDGRLVAVESRGRDVGVVVSELDYTYWNRFGRSEWIEVDDTFYRTIKNGIKGEDVFELQMLLKSAGYSFEAVCDDKMTEAIKDYQRKNNLTVDGIAGKKTITKLGGQYE